MDLVSVIIPVYNRVALLSRAIRSVLAQTYQHFEIIVVDDASCEDVAGCVNAFKDPRIRYIRHEINRGVAAAWNTGLRESKGRFIAFLDSDDEWMPQKLERQVFSLTKDPSYGLAYTSVILVNDSGNPIKTIKATASGYIYRPLLRKNFIGTMSSVVVTKQAASDAGPFDERLTYRADYDFYVRLCRNYRVKALKTPLTIQYVHSGPRLSKNYDLRISSYNLFLQIHHQELIKNPSAYARQLYGLAKLYLKIGEAEEAKKLLREALRHSFHFKSFFELLKLSF